MPGNRLPYSLALARTWWAVADALRATGVAPDDPALEVWREAAWCHLLFASDKYAVAMPRLEAATRTVIGIQSAGPVPTEPVIDHSAALTRAADLFALMKAAVSARYPVAFDRPVAA